MVAIIDYQQAFDADQGLLATLPGEAQVTAWASAVLSHLHIGDKEITVRFVNNEESQQLNNDYRGKDKPTKCHWIYWVIWSFASPLLPGKQKSNKNPLLTIMPT